MAKVKYAMLLDSGALMPLPSKIFTGPAARRWVRERQARIDYLWADYNAHAHLPADQRPVLCIPRRCVALVRVRPK